MRQCWREITEFIVALHVLLGIFAYGAALGLVCHYWIAPLLP